MGKELSFRITQTEYEKIIISMILANYMQASGGILKEHEDHYLRGLLAFGMMNDLKRIVTRDEEGLLTVTDRIKKKIDKILSAYKDALQ